VTLAEGATTRSPGLAALYSILPVITALAHLPFLTPPPLQKPFDVCELRQDQPNRSNTHKVVSCSMITLRA